MNIHVSRTEKV